MRRATFSFCLLLSLSWAPQLMAQDAKTPARLFSKSALVYFELTQPERLVDAALDPQWRELLRQSEPGQKYFQSRAYEQLQAVVAVVEEKMGKKWPDILREAAGGGVYVAVNPGAHEAVVAVKARNGKTLSKLHETIIDLAERDAAGKGQESPVRSVEYEGVTTWEVGKQGFHAILDDLLLVSNQRDSLQAAIDRSRGTRSDSLADVPDFKRTAKLRRRTTRVRPPPHWSDSAGSRCFQRAHPQDE